MPNPITWQSLKLAQFEADGNHGHYVRRIECRWIPGCYVEIRLLPDVDDHWIIEIWNHDAEENVQARVALPETVQYIEQLYHLLTVMCPQRERQK